MVVESRWEPWLRLLLVPELRKVHWARLHRAFGSPEAILGAAAERVREVARVSDETARAILRGPDSESLEREQNLIEETGADLCIFGEPGYPENLGHCAAPPMVLYIMGEMQSTDRFAVVVVGSRTMTQYGKLACQRIVGDLVGAGVTVLSGMAHGVDAVAHETALRHGGRTIAVLAHGLAARDSSHRKEFRRRIAEQGAVVSEFPMTAPAERYHFPTRNHTLAAMGLATVVVEAPEKSGALITAEKALEENRQVFAVPGDITRQTSRGTNELIRSGATLARNGRDVLEDLQGQLKALLSEQGDGDRAAEQAPAINGLSDTAKAVLVQVEREPVHLDVLHEALIRDGVDFGALSTALLELEMKGLVRHLPGNLYTTGSTL